MNKKDLVTQVIVGARENNIGAILFHHAVGQILGVNVTDMKCLDLMMLKGSASPSQLAALTGLSTGATTAMIDRLERARLVERHRHPKDRRGMIVVLTNDARKTLPHLFASMAGAMDALVSSYSRKELELLINFFKRTGFLWTEERQKLQRKYRGSKTRSKGRAQ